MSTLSHCPPYLFLAILAFHSSSATQDAVPQPGQKQEGAAEKSAQTKPHAAPTPPQNPLIARMGTLEIRLSDLITEINRLIPLNFYHRKIPQEKMLEFRKKAFDNVVLDRRIYLDAVDRKLQIEEQAIREKLKNALQKAGPEYRNLDKKRFELELERNRTLIRRLVLTEKNKLRFAKTVPGVTDVQLNRVYEMRLGQDKTAFQAPREARLLHIFVKMDPSRTEKAVLEKKARMAEAKKELDKGVPFSQVARLYSEGDKAKQGGDMGWVKEHSLQSKTLSEKAFTMKSNEVSEVIESLYGLHILKCVEMKPIRTLSFEEVKPSLQVWLKKEHLNLAEERWHKELESRYSIEVLAPEMIVPPKAPKSSPKAPAKQQPGSRPAPSQPAVEIPASGNPDSRPAKGKN